MLLRTNVSVFFKSVLKNELEVGPISRRRTEDYFYTGTRLPCSRMALTLSRLSRAACTMGLGRRALAHDGFAGLNIYKDPTKAPKELVRLDRRAWFTIKLLFR